MCADYAAHSHGASAILARIRKTLRFPRMSPRTRITPRAAFDPVWERAQQAKLTAMAGMPSSVFTLNAQMLRHSRAMFR
jgi:hypothetical protein